MKTRKKVVFIWLIILSPFMFVFSLVTLASFEFFGPLPTFDQLENPQNNLATEIISADSVVIGKYFFENRTPRFATGFVNLVLQNSFPLIGFNETTKPSRLVVIKELPVKIGVN